MPTSLQSAPAPVHVVNPLGGALRHYTDALVDVLSRAGHPVDRSDLDEPSIGGTSRLAWVLRHARTLRRIARTTDRGDVVIITWPVLGFADLLLHRIVGLHHRHAHLVVHDPDPLVRAWGHGPVSTALARRAGASTGLVVHGQEGGKAVDARHLRRRVTQLPHPVRTPGDRRPYPSRGDGGPGSGLPIVRVLGQYKPDRDVAVLEALAPMMAERVRLEIHGRGWPAVAGWQVTDRFLTEDELTAEIRTASVVLVPYTRVFQSGIAVRAVEEGTAFVGPRVSAHEALYEDAPDLLVDASASPDLDTRAASWRRAIESALGVDDDLLADIAERAARRCTETWSGTFFQEVTR